MRKMCNIIVAILFSFIAMSVNAQTAFFADKGQNVSVQTEGRRMIVPDRFRTSELNVAALKSFLWALPSEENVISNRSTAQVIALPMPDGTMARFKIWESSIQEPALQARFSEIRTFRGQGIDDPYATIRCDFNPFLVSVPKFYHLPAESILIRTLSGIQRIIFLIIKEIIYVVLLLNVG